MVQISREKVLIGLTGAGIASAIGITAVRLNDSPPQENPNPQATVRTREASPSPLRPMTPTEIRTVFTPIPKIPPSPSAAIEATKSAEIMVSSGKFSSSPDSRSTFKEIDSSSPLKIKEYIGTFGAYVVGIDINGNSFSVLKQSMESVPSGLSEISLDNLPSSFWLLSKDLTEKGPITFQNATGGNWSQKTIGNNIPVDSTFRVVMQMNVKGNGEAGVALFGKSKQGDSWYSNIKQIIALLNENQNININLRDGTSPNPISKKVGTAKDGIVVLQFNNKGKTVSVLNGDGKVLVTLDIQSLGQFSEGMTPDNDLKEIWATAGPGTSVEIEQMLVKIGPDGKYQEPKTPTPIPPTAEPKPTQATAPTKQAQPLSTNTPKPPDNNPPPPAPTATPKQPDNTPVPPVIKQAPTLQVLANEQLTTVEVLREFKNEVGWAYTARPGASLEQMITDMKRMKELGMNVVYIGHNNPGDANPNKLEPGLSYAVINENATSMLKAVQDAITTSKQVGLDVVLPIGYQIQMGDKWNTQHPDDLRREPDGSLMDHWGSGKTASPYSPQFRKDIHDFFVKINNDLIKANPHIKAINLGDEPMGGDYSHWAKEEFKKRTGLNFDQDPKAWGEFQAGILADMAAWSTQEWQNLNPNVKVMYTFHIQRESPLFPNFEKIFSQTPSNFVFSADTHMHDALPSPITAQEKNLLAGMARTLGWLSKVYGKTLMPWTAANGWGLGTTGGVPEALENARIVTDLIKQNGGTIAMEQIWGWNIKTQGVYDSVGKQAYDPEAMITAVSGDLAKRRDTLSTPGNGRPDIVLYVPSSHLYQKIGKDKITHIAPYDWFNFLNQYNFIDNNIIYLTDGLALDRAKQEGIKIVEIAF